MEARSTERDTTYWICARSQMIRAAKNLASFWAMTAPFSLFLLRSISFWSLRTTAKILSSALAPTLFMPQLGWCSRHYGIPHCRTECIKSIQNARRKDEREKTCTVQRQVPPSPLLTFLSYWIELHWIPIPYSTSKRASSLSHSFNFRCALHFRPSHLFLGSVPAVASLGQSNQPSTASTEISSSRALLGTACLSHNSI